MNPFLRVNDQDRRIVHTDDRTTFKTGRLSATITVWESCDNWSNEPLPYAISVAFYGDCPNHAGISGCYAWVTDHAELDQFWAQVERKEIQWVPRPVGAQT